MEEILPYVIIVLIVSIISLFMIKKRRLHYKDDNVSRPVVNNIGDRIFILVMLLPGILFFCAIAVVAILFLGQLYQKSEEGCSGQATWFDGTVARRCTAASNSINFIYPINKKEKVIVIAQVNIINQVVHFVQVQIQKITGLIHMDIGVKGSVYKTVTIPAVSDMKFSICVTSDVPRPQPGNWMIKIRDRKGNAAYDFLQPGTWASYSIDPLTADYRGETRGLLYAYGGPIEEAYLFGSCSHESK